MLATSTKSFVHWKTPTEECRIIQALNYLPLRFAFFYLSSTFLLSSMNYIRSAVSENRKRYVDDNVNLDLSYITSNIIAMSYPSEGLEGLYRNSYAQVKNFLESKHAGHYKVYNLRSEKQYDLSRFENAANFPFADHQAPPFTTLIEFCTSASEWLKKDKDNVVAIHCKAGKGRTGTVIAALLLHLGLADTADKAMSIYGEERTSNTKGVTIPSQRRYVYYYEFMLKNPLLYNESKSITVVMQQIVIHDIPKSLKNSKEFTIQMIDMSDVCIHTVESNRSEDIHRASNEILLNFTFNLQLQKDFKVLFTNDKGKKLLSFCLNATFVSIMNDNIIHLNKKDIDLAFHDKLCKEFDPGFSIDIVFKNKS